MTIEEEFNQAVLQSKELTEKPDNSTLLKLYALFKQGKEGNITGERPGGFDFKGAAKYDAWEKELDKPKDLAMREYIDLLEELKNLKK